MLSEARVLKYKTWIAEADQARKTCSLEEANNQYDKAEELITFYTFAPLEKTSKEAQKKIIEGILRKVDVDYRLKGDTKLCFEKELASPKEYQNWLRREVQEHHPIRYIRKQAKDKKSLEGDTQVDFAIETNDLLVLIEVKFTSDISPHTKFGLNRNQIARMIDAGIEAARKKNKRLICLLCTPSELFLKKSRFYYYKINEYSDFSNIQKDIPWRTIKEVKDVLLKVNWISLEETIRLIYKTATGLDSEEIKEAKHFFEERKMFSARAGGRTTCLT